MSEIKIIKVDDAKLSCRAVSLDVNSYNKEKGTIEVVFATETPIKTHVLGERAWEILSFDPEHVNYDRANAGAPFVDNHTIYGSVIENQLGGIERAWTDANKQGRAIIKFAPSPKGEIAEKGMASGAYRSLSVGAKITEYTLEGIGEDDLPVYRATKWGPAEISLAMVPKDYHATSRSEGGEESASTDKPEIINPNTTKMSEHGKPVVTEDAEKAEVTKTVTAPVSVDNSESTRTAVEAEQTRATEIVDLVTRAQAKINLPEDTAMKFIKSKATVDQVRAFVAEEFIKADSFKSVNANVVVNTDETDKKRSLMLDGLVIRSGGLENDAVLKVDATRVRAASEFRNTKLLRIAENDCRKMGLNIDNMSDEDIVSRSITSSTSDLPFLLEGINQRTLLNEFVNTADTWRNFCAVGSLDDKRLWKRDRPGSFSALERVGENGEIKNKSLTDAEREFVQLETFANIINVSRDMIINDDLGEIANYARRLGRAASLTIEQEVYKLLKLNPSLSDNQPVFSAAHNNVYNAITGITTASIDAMRVIMSKQQDPENNEYLDIKPSIFVGASEQWGAVTTVNGSEYDPDNNANKSLQKVNISRNVFGKIVASPRLSTPAFYMFADPKLFPVLMVNFLKGNQSPMLESKEGWNVLGKEWRVILDFGVDFVDYRGAVYNPGV